MIRVVLVVMCHVAPLFWIHRQGEEIDESAARQALARVKLGGPNWLVGSLAGV